MKRVALVVTLATLGTLLPAPGFTLGPPEVLSEVWTLGTLDGRSVVRQTPFAVELFGVSWTAGDEPLVRFRTGRRWSPWAEAHQEDRDAATGRSFSALVPARRATAFQLRGTASGVRAMGINITDGPRRVRGGHPAADAAHVEPPGVVSRAEWGANERLRFVGGKEHRRPSFVPVQKIILHHTVTRPGDPGPATIRGIYRYHTLFRGYADIAYHYLVGPDGRVYKGRYSGSPGTRVQDRPGPENPRGWGVTGTHAYGANRGTIGIALLGTYRSRPLPGPARQALVELLAWLSERHGIDPLGRSAYLGPSGPRITRNITGHRAYRRTECPGGAVARDLPAIRQDVARLLRLEHEPAPDRVAPMISDVRTSAVRRSAAEVRWSTHEPARSTVRFRAVAGGAGRSTRPTAGLTRTHRLWLTGLRRGTTYVFRVGGSDGSGNASWSAPHTFRTRR